MEVSVEDWRDWAYKAGMDTKIISYITFKNEHLFTFDAKSDVKSFATPRSWEYVNAILASEIAPHLLLDAISGAVGKEIGIGFLSFVKVMDRLPDIDAILQNAEGEYSDEVDVLYALSTGLVSAVLVDASDEKIANLLTYTLGLKSEFAVLIVQDLQRNGVRMEHLESFKKWVEKFSFLLA